MKRIGLRTGGMECRSCEQAIEAAVKRLDGVESVSSDYASETTEVTYDEDKVDEDRITKRIGHLGYSVSRRDEPLSRRFGTFALALGIFAILAGIYMLFGDMVSLDYNISMETGFAALFILGFFTGFHCIGMCGGFVLSYSKNIRKAGDFLPHILFGSGKTVSYTAIGALFGLLGSFIAFTTELRGGVAILAGAFLVIYGINMLNLIPALRRLQLRIPSIVPAGEAGKRGPLMTGLLNGLMIACGPLQALYIFAAGTGSALAGAQALFFFGLGTLAPLLTFGIASNFLSRAFSHNVVRFSGILVIMLGLSMASNGFNLLGVGFVEPPTPGNGSASAIEMDSDGYQVIRMNVTAYGWEPNSFVLKRGVPVRWVIDAKELNGCNNEIIAQAYGLDIKLKPGVQTIEFTPRNEGVVRWSCWMGMIPGQFVITDDVESASAADMPELPAGGSCSGGCGCGG